MTDRTSTNPHDLTQCIKRKALELGFARVGVTTPEPIVGYEDVVIARTGYEDLWGASKPDSAFHKMANPLEMNPQIKSVISLVRAVGSIDFPERLLTHLGRIYLGRCYVPPADTIEGKRIQLFEEYLASLGITSFFDHSNMQMVDRAIAARAGVVTYGKNNFAYAGEHGSFIVLVSIPVDVELECDVHEAKRPCPPDCHLCADACPTGALATDGSLDPRRCVLYSNFMPGQFKNPEILDLIGVRVHGCDECQAACPRNKHVLEGPHTKDPYLEWLDGEFDLEKMLFADDAYYEACLKPVMFNYIHDIDIFRQNAAIAMGNSGDAAYLPALQRALETGSDQVKRFAARAIEKLKAEA